MAVPGHLFKLAFGGPLFATESWSCNLMINAAGIISLNPDAFQPALEAWHNSALTSSSSAAKLAFIKFNEIDPVTGKYLDEATSNTLFIGSGVTGAAGAAPGQLSLCAALGTAAERGRASKGRIFPPTGASNIAVDASGQITELVATNLATSTKTLINAINTLVSADTGAVSIYSKIGQSVRPVTHVRVGRIIDTQRRRRSSLLEAYVDVSL